MCRPCKVIVVTTAANDCKRKLMDSNNTVVIVSWYVNYICIYNIFCIYIGPFKKINHTVVGLILLIVVYTAGSKMYAVQHTLCNTKFKIV